MKTIEFTAEELKAMLGLVTAELIVGEISKRNRELIRQIQKKCSLAFREEANDSAQSVCSLL